VLHLGCGRGEATAELVALGALVTGLDNSAEALDAARERVPAAALVHAEPQAPPPELLRARFQLVYAGEGTLASTADLDASARAVLAALRPGGYLLLYDEHPVRACVDPLFHWRGSYFVGAGGEPRRSLGEVVTAVAQAGLVVRRVEELPAPGEGRHIPGRFALVARKPA
jgi:SAM-dependent methyltransferase